MPHRISIARKIMFLVYLTFTLAACGQTAMKFDKAKWSVREDIFYAYRERMTDDLMKNYLKKGMTYREVVELLGSADDFQSGPSGSLAYEIMVDYGWNIDPQKGKTLYINLAEDSTVKNWRLEKWRH